jgi:hypothetical protein
MSEVKRRAAWQTLSLAAVWGFGCAEPSFVSLGRNISAVSGEDDAGAAPSLYTEVDAGSSAVAMGDPFDVRVVDPCEPAGEDVAVETDCAARALLPCPAPTIGDPDPLAAALWTLLLSCAAWDSVVRVRFEGGCATSFDLTGSVPVGSPACVLQHLSAERYACAETALCASGRLLAPLAR